MTHISARMRVAPVEPWPLPHVAATEAELACSLAMRQQPWKIAGLVVRVSGPAEIRQPESVFLRIGTEPAQLMLPARLLAGILGLLDPAAHAATGDPARLLLMLALEDLTRALERRWPALNVTLAPDAGAPSAPVPLFLQCVLPDGSVWPARLDLEPKTARELTRNAAALPVGRRPLPDLPLPVAFRIGGLEMTAAELRSLRPGVVIVTEEGEIHPETVLVVAAEHLCWRAMRADGAIRITSRRLPVRKLGQDAWVTGTKTMSGQQAITDVSESERDAPIDALPLRLVFELGHVDLTLSELESIGPGYVFTPARDLSAPIDLVVNGRRIGQGEIVAVGSALGVRVLRIRGVE